jgi:hypothetical protein
MTNNALLNLAEHFKDVDTASIFHKNLNKFCENIKELLNKEYVDTIKLEDISKGLNHELEIDKEGVRKEVAESRSE